MSRILSNNVRQRLSWQHSYLSGYFVGTTYFGDVMATISKTKLLYLEAHCDRKSLFLLLNLKHIKASLISNFILFSEPIYKMICDCDISLASDFQISDKNHSNGELPTNNGQQQQYLWIVSSNNTIDVDFELIHELND